MRRDSLAHSHLLLSKKRLPLAQITPIGLQRVGRQSAFNAKMAQIPFGQWIENLPGRGRHKENGGAKRTADRPRGKSHDAAPDEL